MSLVIRKNGVFLTGELLDPSELPNYLLYEIKEVEEGFCLDDLIELIEPARNHWENLLDVDMTVFHLSIADCGGKDRDGSGHPLQRLEITANLSVDIWDAHEGACLTRNLELLGVDVEGNAWDPTYYTTKELLSVPILLNKRAAFTPNPENQTREGVVQLGIEYTLAELVEMMIREFCWVVPDTAEMTASIEDLGPIDWGTELERQELAKEWITKMRSIFS